ncbi:HAD hydrolase-like protein [Dyadobacter sp. 32]|uniref:HAD hydrolase-like protein n=1 Tax=Dyadobacter sp. 32 TaxID=538966 RepID=UPI0011EE730B
MRNSTQINQNINSDTVFFFDMDETLIETDFANFLSYQEAIQSVMQSETEIKYVPNERFNRTTLSRIFPNLTEEKLVEIVKQKEINYINHLTQTKLNKTAYDILIRYSKTNKTVLVTNCREDRAILTLEYHNLIDKFSHLLFKQTGDKYNRVNKYINALTILSLSAENVIAFENDKIEIEDAKLAGIHIDNIISL